MRFLIVDDSAEFREHLGALIRGRWESAELVSRDPARITDPAHEFGSGGYAAVLLDARPGGADGVEWILRTRSRPMPPILLLTAEGGEDSAVRAMRAGASDFLLKSEIDGPRLLNSIADVLREAEASREEASGAGSAFLRTAQFDVRLIGSPVVGAEPRVPGYRILRQIGEGGMARVYLAEREHDGARLVLKLLDPAFRQDDSFLKRFVQEYKILVSIENEHVAKIHDQGFAGTHPYIAMEYFPGGDLQQRIRAGLSSLAALRLTSQIAKALDAIHARGIVHRDIKPQNIMFRDNGRPALVDFGLAKNLAVKSTLTRQGELLATPRYMSPEQCLGDTADHRSDLYSLGIVFYEMITGRKLYESQTPAEMIQSHVHGSTPVLPARLSGYQSTLDRLLARRPEDRFQSARDLFAAIAI